MRATPLTAVVAFVPSTLSAPAMAASAQPPATPAHPCLTGASDFDGNGGTDAVIGGYGNSGASDNSEGIAVEMRTADGATPVTIPFPAASGEDDEIWNFGFASS